MKKITILLLLMICGFATACQSTDEQTPQPEPAAVAKAIVDAVDFMSPAEKGKAEITDYYDINTEGLSDAALYICGSGAYPDEVAVFQFNTKEQATAAKDAINKRLEEQIKLYETYTPDEMYKLKEATVTVYGNYAVFYAVNDKAAAAETANSYFK